MKALLLFFAGCIFSPVFLFADNFGAACTPAQAKIDLDINNVRTTILNSGDLWWNLSQGKYEVPKGGGANSVFCGGLWFGALDDNGQLMTACMNYRQSGVDFWPGPIDTAGTGTIDSTCWKFDRLWKLNRADVEAFRAHYTESSYVIPEAILSWPGNGDPASGHAHFLAPFTDIDGDGIYNPQNGDYPAFAFNGAPDCNYNLLGDQAIWWVFNDKGNTHTETDGNAFGMEVHAMAYAFRSNDALNDATFYRYQVINRSAGNWNQVWMGQYTDVDLGSYDDDYVGCDVERGMGYGYNGDQNDGTSAQATLYTYGAHPPAIGIDFVQGPLADANDFTDNDHDSIVDENGERIKLSMFKYYNSDFSITGNPASATEFYRFLKGQWKDGSPQTYGGSGCCSGTPAMFMFPGTSDPYGWGTGGNPQMPWDEVSSGNTPFDRRFLASTGPFTMHPGEVQTITIAVPWARDTSAAGTNLTSVTKLQEADDYLQQLFDNCFTRTCGSDAPPEFTASVNGLTVYFTATAADGMYQWDFGDNHFSSDKHPSHTYTSEGNYTVCLRVITACDTQTVCSEIYFPVTENECGPPVQRLEGKGSGNQVLEFTTETVEEILTATDQRSHFPWYKPLHAPVRITYENYQSLTNGDYRIAFDSVSGTAHWKLWLVGGSDTVYSDSTISFGEKQLIPQWGLGVRVQQVPLPGFNYNPDRNGALDAWMSYDDPQKNWLDGIADNDDPTSFNWIRSGDFAQNLPSACGSAFNDRSLGAQFIDPDENFESLLGGTWAPYRLCSNMPATTSNCYTAGITYNSTSSMLQTLIGNLANVDVIFTPDKSKWSRCPVFETGNNTLLTENNQAALKLRLHPSVDKDGRTVAQGGLSDPNNPEAADYIGATGMGWFPGYAINLETGERLNISFGENSALVAENGRDLVFNPTATIKTTLLEPIWGGMHYIYVFGHNGDAVFTSGALTGELKDVPAYDAGKAIYKILTLSNSSSELGEIFHDAMWCSIPVLNPGHSLLETTAAVHLRVEKPFAAYNTSASPVNNDFPLYGFSIDKLNLCCNMYDGSVNAFPNPFSESCTIIFDNTENEIFRLKLYDMRGRLVRTYENITSDRVVVQSAGLMNGVYIYSLEKGDEKPVTGRIILR